MLLVHFGNLFYSSDFIGAVWQIGFIFINFVGAVWQICFILQISLVQFGNSVLFSLNFVGAVWQFF